VVPRRFSVEKKIEILEEHLEEGISVPVLAEKYSLSLE
jgi:transposase-like protein